MKSCPFCGLVDNHDDKCYFTLKLAGAMSGDLQRAWDRRVGAAGTGKDVELADVLNVTLWLYRRLPHAYGKPPFVDRAILTMAERLGLDDVPAAIKERATVVAHTKAGTEPA